MSESALLKTELARRITALLEAVATAQRGLDGGLLVDFSGLDSEIISLCRDTQHLERADAKALLPAMIDLGDRLEVLSANLKRQATAEPETEESRRRALSAYASKSEQS